MMSKKTQIWSLDTIVATVIFVSALSAFIVLITSDYSAQKSEEIKSEAEIIPEMLITAEDNEVSIIEENKVSTEKIKRLKSYGYKDLKSKLGIKGEFCVFFEDSEGNLINLSEVTGEGESVGIGNSRINVSEGVQCTK